MQWFLWVGLAAPAALTLCLTVRDLRKQAMRLQRDAEEGVTMGDMINTITSAREASEHRYSFAPECLGISSESTDDNDD